MAAPTVNDMEIVQDRLGDLGTPTAGAKGTAVGHTFENSVGAGGQFGVAVGKLDRHMDNLHAELARLLNRGSGIGQHVGSVHDVFDGVVKHPARRSEVVLEFNQNQRGGSRVHVDAPMR